MTRKRKHLSNFFKQYRLMLSIAALCLFSMVIIGVILALKPKLKATTKNTALEKEKTGIDYPHEAKDLDEIIQRNIIAVGGEFQWKAVKALRWEGIEHIGDEDIHLIGIHKAPNLLRLIIENKQGIIRLGYNGNTAWKVMEKNRKFSKPIIFEGQEKDQFIRAGDYFPPLLNYKQHPEEFSWRGKEDINGQSCFRIERRVSDRITEVYYVDDKNYYILKWDFKQKYPDQTIVNETYYEDYRQVGDDIVMPFKDKTYTNGKLTSQFEYTKYQINPGITSVLFEVPDYHVSISELVKEDREAKRTPVPIEESKE